jgi:outer membrane protein OmpA-like peptidoglycan-associated protein
MRARYFPSRSASGLLIGSALTCCVLLSPAPLVAQGSDGGSRSGVSLIVGAFGGRFDIHNGPELDVLGGRLGVGLSELVQLTGLYWSEVDFSDASFLDGWGWGGEAQLNLNAGFGLTPFVTAGLARVRVDTLEEQTAAILGAGLSVPLGPVVIHASARDYIFGVDGLGSGSDDADATHNWLFSAGLTAYIGGGRSRAPVAAVQPPPPAPAPAVAAPAPRPTDEPAPAVVVTDTAAAAAADPGAVRSYQSDRRIEIPLPLEGSITIRYGPEPAAQAPVIVTQAGAARAPETEAAPQAPGAGAAVAPTPQVGEPSVDRIVEQTLAALLPRMEASDARRHDQLLTELNRALAAQQSLIRELVRAEVAALGDPRAPAPAFAPPARAPEAAAVDTVADAIARMTARLEAVRAETARLEAARAGVALAPLPPAPAPAAPAPDLGEARLALAQLASRHGTLLSTTETERGPALVLADGAFPSGSALATDPARSAVRDLAGLLTSLGAVHVFVQGHTDSVGDEASNQRLSEQRAETVRSLLVQAGADPARTHAIGYGEGRPIATNNTEAGRALNRRVEIVIGASGAGTEGGVQ